MKQNKRGDRKRWTINGVTRKKQNGYILVKIGNLWTGEHRLVVEDKIGRVLNANEVIHHIDGNKENNKIENLMVFQSQKEHQAFHLKVAQFGMTNAIKKQIENRWKEFENG